MSAKLQFSAAIFDMDGLLIDSERIIMHACIDAAKSVGMAYSQAEYCELIGRNAVDSTRVMTAQLGGEENFIKVMHQVDEILMASTNHFPLKLGALNSVKFFHAQNIPCAVASSSNRHVIEHRLSSVQVLDYFGTVASGDEVLRGKPHPDIYLLALKKLGVDAAHCIAFEDSEFGAQAAIAAGLKVVVVPDLKKPSEFVQKNCFMLVKSLSEALEKIKAL